MCIFHDILSVEAAHPVAHIVVALAGLQNNSLLLKELSTVDPQSLPEGSPTRELVNVAQDPYRFLRTLLSFEAEVGNGERALLALQAELEVPAKKHFVDPAPLTEKTQELLRATTIEQALRLIAISGHNQRTAFLQWFRDNPAGLEATQAIRFLETVALEVLPVSLPNIEQDLRACCMPKTPQVTDFGGSQTITFRQPGLSP